MLLHSCILNDTQSGTKNFKHSFNFQTEHLEGDMRDKLQFPYTCEDNDTSEDTKENDLISNTVSEVSKIEPSLMFECDVCGISFTNKLHLIDHIEIHKLDEIKREPDFTEVNALDDNQETYNCSKCNQVFNIASELTEHKCKHLNVKLYSCPVCSKSFTSSSSLCRHKAEIGRASCRERV